MFRYGIFALPWLVVTLFAGGVRAQEIDFDSVLEDEDEQMQTDMQEAPEGDLREFSVVTDDDINALAVGDIYKSNSAFFKVVAIGSKSTSGGSFTVQRTAGKFDPTKRWARVSGAGPLSIVSRETLMDRFISGGPLMYPIAFLLLVTIIIAFNSIFLYRKEKQCPTKFVSDAHDAIVQMDVDDFDRLAANETGLLPTICRRMTTNLEASSEEEIRFRCETEAKRQIGMLRLPLKGLTFIASVAPLLGLLGTVIGMIACFDSLADEAASASKAQAMAAGIKVALLTTAAGLCVAVPSSFVYFIFNQRLNTIIADCEGIAGEFVHYLATHKRQLGTSDEEVVALVAEDVQEV